MWFRRDLRLNDLPGLCQAASSGHGDVLGLFVHDDRLRRPAGHARLAYLGASLSALDESMGGALCQRVGKPTEQVVAAARDVGARSVHVTADFGPYGRRRDRAVSEALAEHGIELVATGSPYAVDPGVVRNAEGRGYEVFSAFRRGWEQHGWDPPFETPDELQWLRSAGHTVPVTAPADEGTRLPQAGEAAARRRWERFIDPAEGALASYAVDRDRPDREGTSRMSAHLRWGETHPRTLLASIDPAMGDGHERMTAEIAWREFYGDVLFHRPDAARDWYRDSFQRMTVDDLEHAATSASLVAWQQGRTGFPLVDAGMRQLLAEGWMHNRVRMVTASFLVKDLHLDWRIGARWFMRHLVDGDLASNQMGWQWVAGSGNDAAPYFRVFNPVRQGLRFDPDGDYVRRYVPELRHMPGASAHEPWRYLDGGASGYPDPIVDHAEERREALRRYQEMTGRRP